jgi:hypothetical protein
MSKAKIKLTVDLSNPKEVIALNSLLTILAEGEPSPKTESKTEEKSAPKKETKKESPKAEAKKEKVEDIKVKDPETVQASEITIEQVRKLVSQKAGDHRDSIKEKLVELGAKNVTELDPGKYEDFSDFLKELK